MWQWVPISTCLTCNQCLDVICTMAFAFTTVSMLLSLSWFWPHRDGQQTWCTSAKGGDATLTRWFTFCEGGLLSSCFFVQLLGVFSWQLEVDYGNLFTFCCFLTFFFEGRGRAVPTETWSQCEPHVADLISLQSRCILHEFPPSVNVSLLLHAGHPEVKYDKV